MSATSGIAFEQLQSQHCVEAERLGWKASFTAGTLVGDVSVSVLPADSQVLKDGADPLYYLYRLNPVTGLYALLP